MGSASEDVLSRFILSHGLPLQSSRVRLSAVSTYEVCDGETHEKYASHSHRVVEVEHGGGRRGPKQVHTERISHERSKGNDRAQFGDVASGHFHITQH